MLQLCCAKALVSMLGTMPHPFFARKLYPIFLHGLPTVFSGVLSCGSGWHPVADMLELTISDFYGPLFVWVFVVVFVLFSQVKALS